MGTHRPDFIVEGCVILELKACTRFEPVFTKQVLTYLRVIGLKVGLLINFNEATMMHAIKRFVL
jgi:GxxExxY protein